MSTQPHEPARRPLALPRTPSAIREHLQPGDRAAFEEQYQQALRDAAGTYSLTAVNDLIDGWWPAAVLGQDPSAHARVMDDARRIMAGEDVGSRPRSRRG